MKKSLATVLFTYICLLAAPCYTQSPIFYGMTYEGGIHNIGTIISFNPSTNAEDTLHSFGWGNDGNSPSGNLIFCPSNGLFYGMTVAGGSRGYGAIISFNPSTNAEDTVHSFGRGDDGQVPDGNLVYYTGNRLFYAMTNKGGKFGLGAIISFNPSTNAEDTVHSFGRGTDGQHPCKDLVYDAGTGLFYGMTAEGGSLDKGAIISFNPGTNAEDTVHSFGRGTDGSYPAGSLVYDAGNGFFYAMTFQGGSSGSGAIISFNPSTNAEDTVHSFGRGDDGRNPNEGLVYYSGTGLFYGMTQEGGILGKGAIISFNPLTNTEDTVHSFGSGTDGQTPEGDFVYNTGNGLFYGMTYAGGSLNLGTIVSFNPGTNAEDTVHSFGRGADGQKPTGDLVLYNPAWQGIDEVKTERENVKVYPNPSDGAFTLRVESEKLKVESLTVEVYNMLGEKVSQLTIHNYQLSIDLSNQPNGIYFYRVITESGNLIGEGKLVIEK